MSDAKQRYNPRMSIRSSIPIGVIVLSIATACYLALSGDTTPPDTLASGTGNDGNTNIEQASPLEVNGTDLQRESQATANLSGSSTLELYFRSEAGVNGGVFYLDEQEYLFEGSYLKIENLVDGSYAAAVTSPKHLNLKRSIELVDGESQSIDIDLEIAAAVRGKIINANGQAVAGATVAALEDVVDDSLYVLALADFFNYGNIPTWASDEAVTDENGEYVMTNLKLASFNLLVSHADYRPFKTEHAVKLEDTAETVVDTISINEGVHLELMVRNTNDDKIDGAVAQWRPNSLLAKTVIQRSNRIPKFEGNKDGVVYIKSLPSDVLTLSVQADGFAQQQIDIDLSDKTIGETLQHDVMLTHGVNLSGTVLNADGKPCSDTMVALSNAKDFNIEAASKDEQPLRIAADEAGGFHFDGIAPGQYFLITTANDYARKVTGPFSVADEDVSDLAVVLTHGATLIVTVLDGEDVPSSNVAIGAVSVNATNIVRQRSDDSGMATFTNVSAGNYQVITESSGAALFKFVELIDDEVTEVTLGGLQETATLSGVISRAGEVIDGARVSIITDSGVKVAATDKEGLYTISEMPLGDFIVIVNVNSGLNGNSAFYGSLQITSGGEVQHDIELPNAGLEVPVTAHSDQRALAQVPVAVRPLNGTNISGGDFGLTNAEGIAKFPSLNDGEYMVSVGTAAAPFISPQDNGLGSKIVSPISVRDGMGVERVDVSLSEGATVKVQVSNQAGELLAGVNMHYLDANGQPMNIISLMGTNAKGVAQLKGLPTGPGRIMVRHPEIGLSEFEVNLSDGEVLKKRITLDSGTKLMVTVVDENDQPLSGVLCTALDHRGAALSYVWALSETQATQTAYFSGTAQKLGPLPIGNYKIQLIRPGKDIVIHDVFVNGESVQNLRLRFTKE